MLNETPVRAFLAPASDQTAANRILAANELSIDENGNLKKGDGSTVHPSLPRLVGGGFKVVKSSDQTKTADAALANDTDLIFSMVASTKYRIRILVFFDTTAAADFKFALSGPAAPTLVRIFRKHVDPAALTTLVVAAEVAYTASTAVAAGAGTTGGFVEFEMIVHNGVNAGTFGFQWAQNTSDASNTIVRAGSFLAYEVI